MKSNCPTIVIAGTNSGSGKTSVTLGLAAALRRRGLKVQAYKVGPDFLDPSYLTIASGRTCYNLDSWMMGREYMTELFVRTSSDADVAIVEGVMGLFDGASPTNLDGSTAEIASILDAPITLIASAHGLARSFAAVVKGFAEFDESVTVGSVIANRSGSDRHVKWLDDSLKAAGLPPLVGAIKRDSLPQLPSRHLGLVTADKELLSEEVVDQLADACQQNIDIDALLKTARRSKAIEADVKDAAKKTNGIRLGVAKDKAFHFYYPDNLQALEQCGCQIVEFSPLSDSSLPEGLSGLYIPGGYPEVYARQLSENMSMLDSIRQFAAAGKSIYAECGGLMYIGNKIITKDGNEFSMAGLIEIDTQMLNKFSSLGYVEVTTTGESLWGAKGAVIRGHEFHYSKIANTNDLKTIYSLQRRSHSDSGLEGFQKDNILASYVHLHFAGRDEIISSFVKHIKGNDD